MTEISPILLSLIALKAGAKIMEIYASDFDISTKSDASPVTEADAAAEHIILCELEKLSPEIPVVAEEAVSNGIVPEIGDLFYLVDPLDGTKEFVSKNGEFTVNIALIKQGEPVVGVVYAPALGEIFWGVQGRGAHAARVENGKVGCPVSLNVRSAPPKVVAIGSRSHGSAETEDWLSRYEVESFVAAGSSLKFCRVAQGAADIYPRMGRTMEWDTAAGDAVLRAAGGIVTTLDGQPLFYGKRGRAEASDFANPYFVAYGDISLKKD
ncbi:3'(2'),5'-bisphosphate nucleotidase CysQ [Asticcacaulis excentricus]|uniref:3'(2'),5'-bisphosphate nucleotidase CysQ n=1 Tax=Asticcacaulis excentricus (strain ATCC 15261 / DSM 4724 / KCTC 12464 / NCIMB 9791 / VKM B-1370 / CB 48) TaxID=573065 RepID=E8RMR2_ASTEC|nr:3'(2'),5'-bisphosphate nucleotidase CysQ [Asticcacaulis excentricus]ADU13943.1 3'(2'),5'-bisphosphate nucleotidase [Asticcacaulis excentricus CB 48]